MRLKAAVVPALAVAILTTAIAGVAVATTTTSKGLAACATSKHVLVTASATGKCPKHDNKVAIGAKGLRGARGATGPSNGYLAVALPLVERQGRAERPNLPSQPPTTVASMVLPAGSYVLDGVANVVSDDAAASDYVSCLFSSGQTTSSDSEATLPPAPQNGDLASRAAVAVTSAMTLKAKATVTLACRETPKESSTGSMTAVKVATLQVTNDKPAG
jgi:hypothetical protein